MQLQLELERYSTSGVLCWGIAGGHFEKAFASGSSTLENLLHFLIAVLETICPFIIALLELTIVLCTQPSAEPAPDRAAQPGPTGTAKPGPSLTTATLQVLSSDALDILVRTGARVDQSIVHNFTGSIVRDGCICLPVMYVFFAVMGDSTPRLIQTLLALTGHFYTAKSIQTTVGENERVRNGEASLDAEDLERYLPRVGMQVDEEMQVKGLTSMEEFHARVDGHLRSSHMPLLVRNLASDRVGSGWYAILGADKLPVARDDDGVRFRYLVANANATKAKNVLFIMEFDEHMIRRDSSLDESRNFLGPVVTSGVGLCHLFVQGCTFAKPQLGGGSSAAAASS